MKHDTTTINNKRNTSSHISKISQFVCQNQVVFSQNQPVITSFPVLVRILVSKRSIPIRKPTIMAVSPAFGVIFLENIPSANTATMQVQGGTVCLAGSRKGCRGSSLQDPCHAEDNYNYGGDTSYHNISSFTFVFKHGLVKVFCKKCGA